MLRRVLLMLGLEPIGWAGCGARVEWSQTSRMDGVASDAASIGGPLLPAETEALVALAELLVEGRPLPPAGRRHLTVFIADRTTRSSRYLALYRATVSTLDRLAGRPFAGLDVLERSELIARHRLAAWHDSFTPEAAGAASAALEAIRRQAVPDLIRGYYGSPAGWGVVGYESFPGQCGELTRYTRADS